MSLAGTIGRQSICAVTAGTTIQVWTPFVSTKIRTPSLGCFQDALDGIRPPSSAAMR